MQSTYGLYRKVRDASWQVLLDNKINALPVDVIRIAVRNGITILKNSSVKELRTGEIGVSICNGSKWYLIYDDTMMSLGRKRFTLAHELGHIFLGHALIAESRKRTVHTPTLSMENEANFFASRLLAPACVIWGLHLHTAADIARVCNISYEAAKIRAVRMDELYKRQKFLTDPLERQVYDQFKGFIEGNRTDTGKK